MCTRLAVSHMAELTLRQKQSLFLRLFAQLISYAMQRGFEFTPGEMKRSDEQAEINAIGANGRETLARTIQGTFPELAKRIRNNTGSGIRNSLHELGLAVDLNLFRDGKFLEGSEQHKLLGEYWETLHPLARWGGRFGDGNHYSIEHEGKK